MIHIDKAKLRAHAVMVRGRGRPRKEPATTPVSLVRKLVAAERLDGRWGSWFGIAAIQERITSEQYKAGVLFNDAALARERALASPGVNPRAQDMSAVQGRSLAHEDERTIRRHRRALEQWDAIVAALTVSQMKALDGIVLRQLASESLVQEMDLIMGLERLIALWKQPKRRR